MKFVIAILLSGVLLISCTKTPTLARPEPAYTKKVKFTINTLDDYSTPFHQNSYAEVYLGLHKTSLNGSGTQLLWDTLFTKRQLSLYPTPNKSLIIEKIFEGILDNKERIAISYVKSYDMNGRRQQVGSGQNCPTENSVMNVHVGL